MGLTTRSKVYRPSSARVVLSGLVVLCGCGRSAEDVAGELVKAVLVNVEGDTSIVRGFDGARAGAFEIDGLPVRAGDPCPLVEQLPLVVPSGFEPRSGTPYDCPIGQITHYVYGGGYLGRGCSLYVRVHEYEAPNNARALVVVEAHCPDR